jgi:Domain of unknown function (DUF4287)/Domain of unknown function (DUF5655)
MDASAKAPRPGRSEEEAEMANVVDDALRAQVRNIEAQYGRSMSAWTDLIRVQGLTKHAEIIAWLKSEHGMTHGNANRVALIARDAGVAGAMPTAPTGGVAADGDPIAALYVGKKAALRPIHDRVMQVINGFGHDVDVAPKRGYVSLRRRRQFAMLQPAAAHVDLGLILPGVPTGGRLEPGGTFNAMFSHRVRIASVEAVDTQLEGWLRTAYDEAG